MIKHLFLKVANERDSELEACEYLETFAKKCGFLPESIDEMRLAFIEALINAKEHAPKGQPDTTQEIYTAFTAGPETLTIEVRDFGSGFDPATVEKPDIKKKLKSSYKRGWGLMLMEKLMDGCEVASFPPSGTLIKMVKKRLQVDPQDVGDIVRERKRIERLKYILGSFLDLSSFLCQNRDLETGLRSMLRIMLGTLGISRGAIFIHEPAKELMVSGVDIKLRTRERLPKFRIPAQALQQMMQRDSLEITEQLLALNPEIPNIFSKDEVAGCYLLRVDSEVLGILMLGNSFRTEEKESYDGDIMTTLARNISSAINTFRLLEQLKATNQELDQNVRELGAVREASQTISSELEMENLPFTVERIFGNVMKIGKFSLSVLDPHENRYTICQTNRPLPLVLDMWSSPISRYVIQKMEPLFVPDLAHEKRFQFSRASTYTSNSFIVIPIIVQDEVLGLISMTDRTDGQELTERDFHLAQLLSAQLGIALKNANLYKLGISDGLTKLYTAHYFKMRLSQEISRSRRVKSPLSLLMLDMDKFESINAEFGDETGDAVLSRTGALIRRQIRFNDIACRIGGDKFAIILSDTGLDGAMIVAEKLRTAIPAQKLMHKAVEIQVTASIGLVSYDQAMSLEQFVEAAEKQLQDAIAKGGNVISTPQA
ncbi:MAG TPA: diguanylate cyclase [Candidatus Ozemobacteraceae bacterium]|nr:diguanylate cyclase [Candidatus Ozemobacteraceae bacterium]